MTDARHIAAARATLKTHTDALRLDDEDNPALAMWHALYSLAALAETRGDDLREILESVLAERDEEKKRRSAPDAG